MPGRMSRNKGLRLEREIRQLHDDLGVPCERVPLSGAAGGSYTGDLKIANDYTAEVKGRASGEGFVTLERWLGNNDLLFLRRDRHLPMVVLPWATYAFLISHLGKD